MVEIRRTLVPHLRATKILMETTTLIQMTLNGKCLLYLHGMAIVESFGSGLYSSLGKYSIVEQ